MSSNDHPHPYGLFIGGNKLDTDQATLVVLHALRQRHLHRPRLRPGAFPCRHGGGRGAADDAVNKAETGGSVTQEVAWVVTPDKAECKINGTVVASYPKADLGRRRASSSRSTASPASASRTTSTST